MRDKLLVVTLFDNYNHGNRLQNYALQVSLKTLGFDVDNLCCVSFLPMPIKERLLRWVKRTVKILLAFLGVRKYQIQVFWNPKRRKRFEAFTDKYIDNKIYSTYDNVLKEGKQRWDNYRFVVTGSDQVWHNWSHTPQELDFFYLSFVPRDKRVAYAPSFGFTEFPEEDYETHKKGLLGFPRLSCREQDGCELIKKAVGKDAELVLDPTLLLSRSQWAALEEKPFYKVPEHYVLTYFLGNVTEEYVNVIRQLASGREVIHVLNPKDKLHYLTNPAEFLWLIHHADFICTDSFHGTVFSIIFEKRFIVFRRQEEGMMDMFGRIETLLKGTGLTNRIYGDERFSSSDIDYSPVMSNLAKLRKESMQYLEECLVLENR